MFFFIFRKSNFGDLKEIILSIINFFLTQEYIENLPDPKLDHSALLEIILKIFLFQTLIWGLLFLGCDLPRRYGQFPLELASTPIVDIDPYYNDKRTFIVVTKKGTIFRFSSTNAMFLLSPFNPIRRYKTCWVGACVPSTELSDILTIIY